MKRIRVIFLMLIEIWLLVLPVPLFAAPEGLNLATSPLPIALKAGPGTTVTADLRIKNNSNTTERLKVSLLKFTAAGEDGTPQLADREAGDDYFDWVTFSPSVFDAPPGEWQTIKMIINVPKSAAFGYYLAAAFSRANVDKPTGGGVKAVLVGSTATLVLLDVTSPNTKRALETVSFTSDRKFYEFLPATFLVKLNNVGNIHVAPVGTIFITQGKTQIGSFDINADRGNILPNSTRSLSAAWTEGFPIYVPKLENGQPVMKNGKPTTTLKWDFTQVPKLRIGHYTAHIVMAYNDGKHDIPIEGTVDFWVIPWRLFLYAIAIPVVPALLVYVLMKRRMKKLARKR